MCESDRRSAARRGEQAYGLRSSNSRRLHQQTERPPNGWSFCLSHETVVPAPEGKGRQQDVDVSRSTLMCESDSRSEAKALKLPPPPPN